MKSSSNWWIHVCNLSIASDKIKLHYFENRTTQLYPTVISHCYCNLYINIFISICVYNWLNPTVQFYHLLSNGRKTNVVEKTSWTYLILLCPIAHINQVRAYVKDNWKWRWKFKSVLLFFFFFCVYGRRYRRTFRIAQQANSDLFPGRSDFSRISIRLWSMCIVKWSRGLEWKNHRCELVSLFICLKFRMHAHQSKTHHWFES